MRIYLHRWEEQTTRWKTVKTLRKTHQLPLQTLRKTHKLPIRKQCRKTQQTFRRNSTTLLLRWRVTKTHSKNTNVNIWVWKSPQKLENQPYAYKKWIILPLQCIFTVFLWSVFHSSTWEYWTPPPQCKPTAWQDIYTYRCIYICVYIERIYLCICTYICMHSHKQTHRRDTQTYTKLKYIHRNLEIQKYRYRQHIICI